MPKVLIIDDEAPLRAEVADWLDFEGYEVITANNGRAGLELAFREEPDLIVCDIAMPELDGYGVLLEIRSSVNLNHIPFIFLTASANYEAVRQGMNLGADDYLTKPFKRADLLNAIYSRLRKHNELQEVARTQLDAVSRAFTEEKEKRLLKSRLVAMFSHDFRNPLSSIMSSSELLKNYEDRMTPEHKIKHLDRIGGSVRLLIQMLDDMMAIAEMEHGYLQYRPQIVDIGLFVKDMVDEFQTIYSETHHFKFDEKLSNFIESDPKLLRYILTNLLSNAVKYSPNGSMVTVCLQGDEHAVRLCVADQGVGIPEDDLRHLFEAFYRASNITKEKGTGLGLTIVKECVELCGGSIEVISQVNQGSKFVITLPLNVV